MEYTRNDYKNSTIRLDRPSEYLIKKARRSQNYESLKKAMASATIYIGNLSFLTTEEQIYELFNRCGEIKKIIMGLDRFQKTPCGFCFVIYHDIKSSLNAMKFFNGTRLENRKLEIDLDPGFEEGRQFGRGVTGGQVRDEVTFNARTSFRRGGERRRFATPRGRGGYRGGRGFRDREERDRNYGQGEVYIPANDPTFNAPTTFNPMADMSNRLPDEV